MAKDQKFTKSSKHNQDAFFASCPKGLEGLLEEELKSLGIADCFQTVAGVYFSNSASEDGIRDSYKACLWSRLANKILLPLDRINARSADEIYDAVKAIPWEHFVRPTGDLVVDFIGTDKIIKNSQFGALKIKDAIVDRIRDISGERPSVNKQNPDLRINARLNRGYINLSLDMSGDSLHRRGYRLQQGAAPLKENLAAAVLIRASWPDMMAKAKDDQTIEKLALLDPMCGSATLLIEAALMAADVAPGIARTQFGFESWSNFREDLWQPLLDEAKDRQRQGLASALPEIRGYDMDPGVLRAAESNIKTAGLSGVVNVICKPLLDFSKPSHTDLNHGLVICNPPYGERLGELEELSGLYRQLGDHLKKSFVGWRAGVFTGAPQLGKSMGLKATKRYKLFNGTIPSELLCFDVDGSAFVHAPPVPVVDESAVKKLTEQDLSPGSVMVLNRIRKNLKPLRRWLKQADIDCFRVYDADIPEYSAAIDVYGDAINIQEYRAPKTIDEDKAEERFKDLVNGAVVALDADPIKVFTRQRQRQKGADQYQRQEAKVEEKNSVFWVKEYQAELKVNLGEYLDTGIFLDHRPVRRLVADAVAGKKFLNLFCYTATATVQAALAGARRSVSVDMSNTYLAWAKQNFEHNNLNLNNHSLVREDCFEYLHSCRDGFDVILMDPPSFSNSKKMESVLDVQRDHVRLITRCMELLRPKGHLIFSNNLRSFKLDYDSLSRFNIVDVSAETLDLDFKRNPKIHQCWVIRLNSDDAGNIETQADSIDAEAASSKNSPWSTARIK